MSGSRLPIVVSVPHGGIEPPPETLETCLLEPLDFSLDGDLWARELYDFEADVLRYVSTTVPRAIVDMNREPDDRPPGNPDGVVKRVTIQGSMVWRDHAGPSTRLANSLVLRYHSAYHESLVKAAHNRGAVLGVDCHTMLAVGPVGGAMAGQHRPIACVSNRGDWQGEPAGEPITAPAKLVQELRDSLQDELAGELGGFNGDPVVRLNDPFGGGYITRRHGRTGTLPWIQIELNRALYEPDAQHVTPEPDLASRVRLRDLGRLVLRALERTLDRTR